MERRRGPENHRSGPHLPTGTPIGPSVLGPRPGEEPFDPAKRMCFNCGDRHGILEFALIREGRPAGHWLLCGPCWEWGNVRDPRDADPLTA